MTTTRPARLMTHEIELQTEAAAVEQLRRQIAEMPSRGEVASPQLLAEFARAQKSYLDKKIQFEKQRRAHDEGRVESGRRQDQAGAWTLVPEQMPADPAPFAPDARPYAGGVTGIPRRLVVMLVTLAIALAAAAFAWLSR